MLLLLALVAGIVTRRRSTDALRAMSHRQWLAFGGLCLASLLLSQLLPLRLPWSDPLLRAHPATAYVALFAAVPYLIAGAALNIPAAVLVALFAGLGRALGQTGAPVDIPAAALAAAASGWLLRQNYTGRVFRTLRHPVVAGTLGRLLWAPLILLATSAAMRAQVPWLAALDLGLYLGWMSLAPLWLEGMVSGFLVALILWIAPHWRPYHGLVPSPLKRSLQRQLTMAFLSFASIAFLASAALAFLLSARAARQATAEQIVFETDAVALRLGGLQRDLVTTLAGYGADPVLADADPQRRAAALGRLRNAAPLFSHVTYFDGNFSISSADDTGPLTHPETELVAAALAAGAPRFGVEIVDDAPRVSVAVPQPADSGRALLGRVAPATLATLSSIWAQSGGEGGLIVDEASQIVLRTGAAGSTKTWDAPSADEALLSLADGRTVYRSFDTAGTRQLTYYTLVPESGWKVVTVVPQAQILRAALSVTGPLSLMLLAVSGLFFLYVARLGQAIARPIGEISQASRAIAGGGGLERPVRSQREDEIGQLTLAFSGMQRSLRQRLDELSLLLSVSNNVAATMNLSEGMGAVLQGILRGTGAAGARVVIRNPNGPAPLTFAEGPAAEAMAVLDRAVVRRMRADDELRLTAPAEIESELGAVSPVAALFALPLRLAGEYQGALYAGYRQPHYFDSEERSLLRTLAGQASVLVQNAYLFAAAEGGRRRLAAVLASTPNAVLVTDQTDRVLLLNPAMERTFELQANEVVGRPVADALSGSAPGRALAARMIASREASTKLDVAANGRDFLAEVSSVYNSDGQAIGRVAVLQDVTDLKEVDRLKSEFLDGISHDLRSPLTYMRNYVSLLPLPEDPATEQQYVNKIESGIDRMSALVEGLLEMANLRAGTKVQFDHVNAADVLVEVAQEYASPAWTRGVRLVVEAATDLPPVKADPALLRRAITNYVTNALKYAPESGPVYLRAAAHGDEVILSVVDHGPGINPADRPQLFQKFYRGQQGATDRQPGSGLGLAIVKSIADLHGGRAWCQSEAEGETVFALTLPALRDA